MEDPSETWDGRVPLTDRQVALMSLQTIKVIANTCSCGAGDYVRVLAEGVERRLKRLKEAEFDK